MDRKRVLLANIDKSGLGLEIGPSHNPVAPKREGYSVAIMDHLSKEGLIEKYSSESVCIGNIEEVDYIWTGERYSDLVGGNDRFDWIIASHVIEHVPDLVSFLQGCEEILKEGGVLSLAVPDARRCFDQFRPLTGLANVLDAYHAHHAHPSHGRVLEYYLNASSKNDKIAWARMEKGDSLLLYSQEDALNKYRESLGAGCYIDVHVWCFSPNLFRLVLNDLAMLSLTSFEITSFVPTDGAEFFVTLQKTKQPHIDDRLALLELFKSDCYEAVSPKREKKKKRWYRFS